MKKILSGTVAAIALIATPAMAQTNQRHYAGTVPIVGSLELTNPSNGVAFAADLVIGLFDIGTRYRAQADAPVESETATPTYNVQFTMSGTVNRDCSF